MLLQNEVLNIIALVGVFISASIFLLCSKRHAITSPDIKNYLLADKQVNGKDFSGTFAASSVSLGGNMLFFIACHQQYGYLMLLGPMMFLFTQFILLITIKKIAKRKLEFRTVADIWFLVFPSITISRAIAIISALANILAFFVEVYIGSIIVAVLLPSTELFKTSSFICIGLIVLAYAYKGGYRAIIKTDVMQISLMMLGLLMLIFFAIQAPVIDPNGMPDNIIRGLFSFDDRVDGALFAFIAWALAANICECLTTIMVWQRMSAVTSPEDALQGMYKGFWKFLFVLWAPVMSFMLLYLKGYDFNTLQDLLQLITDKSGLLSYIIFPLVIIGFAAALFSSADTNLIAAIYSICDQNTFGPKLKIFTERGETYKIKRYLAIIYVLTIALTAGLHFLLQSEITQWFLPLMYAIWGVPMITAPIVVYALYSLNKNLPPVAFTKFQEITLILFFIFGVVIISIGVLKSAATEEQFFSHITTLIALAIVSLGTFLSCTSAKARV